MTTGLLVSVRDVKEAACAFAGGADVIDVKEPSHGPLGAASLEVVTAVCDYVDGRVPVSAACGELLEARSFCVSRLPETLAFAKIGLAGCRDSFDWQQRLTSIWQRFPPSVARVAVAYADWQVCDGLPPEEIIAFCAGQCDYLLLDTTDKTKCLQDHASASLVERWGQLAAFHRMRLVVAGSLTLDHLDAIVPAWQPTYVAVRGAACEGDRESTVSQQRVADLRQKLDVLRSAGLLPTPPAENPKSMGAEEIS